MRGRNEGEVFSEIERIRLEMERFFESLMPVSHRLPTRHRNAWRPPTDVYETETCVEVRVEVAGMREEDFRISLADRTLIIAGRREDPSAKRVYQQMEIAWGEFRTEVYLPWFVDEDNVEASYKDGFLIIVLPKAEAHKRRIPVNVVLEGE
ncbi:MAG: Hsp20/alpha crystallin family protein [Anaerolineae bacterium]